jgi:hypothetical protein
VERTLAWLGRNRRLSKDYEFLPETEEAFILHLCRDGLVNAPQTVQGRVMELLRHPLEAEAQAVGAAVIISKTFGVKTLVRILTRVES